MTYDYTGLKDTASRLVQDKGQTVIYKRISSAYNTATGSTTKTTTTYSLVAVVLDYSMAIKSKADSLVKVNDRKVLVAAKDLAVTPTTNDLITIGGVDYTVIAVPKIYNPGGTALLYELHVRK